MNTRFIDTNIFLEAYLRSGETSQKSQRLLEFGKDLYTTWLVISELEWVLRSVYKLGRSEITSLMSSVVGLGSLEIPEKKIIIKALRLFKDLKIDWVDCLSVSSMRDLRIEQIYSYDRDFEKISGIKRLEP